MKYIGGAGDSFARGPAIEEPERIVEERVDLDGLPPPRSHHPVAHLRVHPGELVALSALAKQPVRRVDADAELGALEVRVNDSSQYRQQIGEQLPVAGDGRVAIDRVEEPKCRVGRVIQALRLALREQIRNQSVTHVMGEGAEDSSRHLVPARAEAQAFEADHRVAPPVGEPVVAGDDGAGLLAGRPGASGVFQAAGRRDQELVGGQHLTR